MFSQRRIAVLGSLAVLALAPTATAQAQGSLVLYCTVQEEWCRVMVTAFERETGIKVSMTRKSSGEFYAQLKAEASNPRGDIWWGGTGDPHPAGGRGRADARIRIAVNKELQDWAINQWNASKKRTIGVYAGALGYSYNADFMKRKGGAEPKCWADLLDPRFKDDVRSPTRTRRAPPTPCWRRWCS